MNQIRLVKMELCAVQQFVKIWEKWYFNRCGDESLDNDDEGKPNCGSASGLNALCCNDDLNNICTEHGFPCLIWLRLIYAYKIWVWLYDLYLYIIIYNDEFFKVFKLCFNTY